MFFNRPLTTFTIDPLFTRGWTLAPPNGSVMLSSYRSGSGDEPSLTVGLLPRTSSFN
jgi:hypothetical protein